MNLNALRTINDDEKIVGKNTSSNIVDRYLTSTKTVNKVNLVSLSNKTLTNKNYNLIIENKKVFHLTKERPISYNTIKSTTNRNIYTSPIIYKNKISNNVVLNNKKQIKGKLIKLVNNSLIYSINSKSVNVWYIINNNKEIN